MPTHSLNCSESRLAKELQARQSRAGAQQGLTIQGRAGPSKAGLTLDDCPETLCWALGPTPGVEAGPAIPIQLGHKGGFNQSHTHHASGFLYAIKSLQFLMHVQEKARLGAGVEAGWEAEAEAGAEAGVEAGVEVDGRTSHKVTVVIIRPSTGLAMWRVWW